MVFVLSVLPLNIQVANSNEILWGPSFGNDVYKPDNLVPGAEIRAVRPLVYKSNPDEIIFKITMAESFEDKPFTNKGRYLALNIFVGGSNCVLIGITEDQRCKRIQTVSAPNSPSSYPSSKSSEWIYIYDREVTFGPNKVPTSCKAPWWIESNFKSRDTWAFAISITCLNLPKEFGFYGVSDIDLGQKEVAYTTSSVISINYPFHELATKFGQTSANLNEKSELIDSLKKLSISGNNQSKSLKALIKSTKLSAAKKKTYTATIKSFDNHIKTYNRQISELESLPLGETLKSQVLTFIQSHQVWMKKLTDILDAIIKK